MPSVFVSIILTNIVAIIVYVPPSGNTEAVFDVIHNITAGHQTKPPGAFITIIRDLNHGCLSSTFPTFHQFISCSTTESKTLDLLYTNAKETHS